MPRYTGRAEVRVRGILMESMPGAQLADPLGRQRDGVVGARVYGHVQKAVVPTLTADFPARADLSLADFESVEDQTITLECDDGTIWTMPNGTYSKGDFKSGDTSTYSVTFINSRGPCRQSRT